MRCVEQDLINESDFIPKTIKRIRLMIESRMRDLFQNNGVITIRALVSSEKDEKLLQNYSQIDVVHYEKENRQDV